MEAITDEENEQSLEEIQKEVDKETENRTEEELPDDDPLRFIVFMLSRALLATIAWFVLGFVLVVLSFSSALVYITPDFSIRASLIGVLLGAAYIGAGLYIYDKWRRRIINARQIQSQSKRDG